MRYLLLGDTHLGLYSDSDAWHKVVIDLFTDVHDVCIKEDIKTIIHLGDFFHNRKSMNTKTQEVAHQIADVIGGFTTFIIVGNHDTYYKNTIQPTSLKLFRHYDKIRIVDKPMLVDDIMLVPWGNDIPKTDAKYCFGHFEISGFHMNDSYICKSGIESSSFNQFESTLSGHFHTPTKQGNITYLGSPFQQTFHDVNGKRGFYIFEDGELEFREFNKYPHFIKMTTDKIDESVIGGNIIKLTFDKDYGSERNEKIVDGILNKKPFQMQVDFSKISYEEDEEPEEESLDLIDHGEIIKDYIKKCEPPENIKKKTLTDIILKLSGEIIDE